MGNRVPAAAGGFGEGRRPTTESRRGNDANNDAPLLSSSASSASSSSPSSARQQERKPLQRRSHPTFTLSEDSARNTRSGHHEAATTVGAENAGAKGEAEEEASSHQPMQQEASPSSPKQPTEEHNDNDEGKQKKKQQQQQQHRRRRSESTTLAEDRLSSDLELPSEDLLCYSPKRMQAMMCQICHSLQAYWHCQDCEEFICQGCFHAFHQRGKKANHRKVCLEEQQPQQQSSKREEGGEAVDEQDELQQKLSKNKTEEEEDDITELAYISKDLKIHINRKNFRRLLDHSTHTVNSPVVYFTGSTHAGKSTLLNELLRTKPLQTATSAASSSPSSSNRNSYDMSYARVAAAKDFRATTAGINFYQIVNPWTGVGCLRLIDMEGDSGPKTLPKDLKAGRGYKPSWSEEERRQFSKGRRRVVKHNLPRLAYFTGNLIVHISNDSFADSDYIKKVKQFASLASSDVEVGGLKPSLILVHNKCSLREIYSNCEECTKQFFDQHDPDKSLLEIYGDVRCVSVPLNDFEEAYQRQIQILRDQVNIMLNANIRLARQNNMLLNEHQWCLFFGKSVTFIGNQLNLAAFHVEMTRLNANAGRVWGYFKIFYKLLLNQDNNAQLFRLLHENSIFVLATVALSDLRYSIQKKHDIGPLSQFLLIHKRLNSPRGTPRSQSPPQIAAYDREIFSQVKYQIREALAFAEEALAELDRTLLWHRPCEAVHPHMKSLNGISIHCNIPYGLHGTQDGHFHKSKRLKAEIGNEDSWYLRLVKFFRIPMAVTWKGKGWSADALHSKDLLRSTFKKMKYFTPEQIHILRLGIFQHCAEQFKRSELVGTWDGTNFRDCLLCLERRRSVTFSPCGCTYFCNMCHNFTKALQAKKDSVACPFTGRMVDLLLCPVCKTPCSGSQTEIFPMLEIGAGDLKIGRNPIGSGAFADVFVGEWQKKAVAVKKFKIYDTTTRKQWLKEGSILTMLQHAHIVRCFGYWQDPTDDLAGALVMELMTRGSLHDYIHNRKGDRAWWEKFLKMARQVAEAIQFIHTQNVIHCDINPRNVLVSEDWCFKIADLGIARKGKQTELTGSAADGLFGTAMYLAPETIETCRHTPASDMFAFGVVLWEAFHGKTRFDVYHAYRIMEQTLQGMNPPFSKYCPAELKSLIRDCWRMNPAERPTAIEALERIMELSLAVVQVPPLPPEQMQDGYEETESDREQEQKEEAEEAEEAEEQKDAKEVVLKRKMSRPVPVGAKTEEEARQVVLTRLEEEEAIRRSLEEMERRQHSPQDG
ncbi:hypothetical protein QOT17_008220 [Balamuthia mandrillaris]